MGDPVFRPLADDPSAVVVSEMFDARSEDWVLMADGDYRAAAVETFRDDGSGHQPGIALEWPGRRNHTDELVTVRLLMSPDDALGLAEVLAHAGTWMAAYFARQDGGDG